jgi:hypothetical protein
MIDLQNVTLVVIDCKFYDGAKIAIEECKKYCNFKDIKVFSDIPFYENTILIQKINSKLTYSEFVFKHLVNFIDTDFFMIAQYDGYILNDNWKPEFLHYDYIGACWEYDINNVGNGGFSIRSKRLMLELQKPEFSIIHPEDYRICRFYRAELEKRGFTFAPDELANQFSWEENKRYPAYNNQFGWHGSSPKKFIDG